MDAECSLPPFPCKAGSRPFCPLCHGDLIRPRRYFLVALHEAAYRTIRAVHIFWCLVNHLPNNVPLSNPIRKACRRSSLPQ